MCRCMDIYLSPHHDDIGFSLGHTAQRSGGALVNLFSRSSYVAADMALPADHEARIAAVTALRRKEDELFAARAGLTRHDLQLSEPPVRGISPFDLDDLRPHEADLSSRLVPLLLSLMLISGEVRTRLYCPMGIGGHRDHVCALLSVRRNFDVLSAHGGIFLYEDLHYASNPQARKQGLEQAGRVFQGFELAPVVRGMGPKAARRKMEAVSGYASQFNGPPRAEQFIPASGFAGLHEIVWEVSG